MRNAAFSYTKRQMEDGSKDVTRRIKSTWRVGERRAVIEKGMGLQKGEKVTPLRMSPLASHSSLSACPSRMKCFGNYFATLTTERLKSGAMAFPT